LASFHFALHDPVSRGKGQSLVRTAAYNARARLVDERTGEVWDYGRKGGLLAEAIYAPKDAPDWSRDLQRLVNEIERAEKRGDAQLAMNLDIALPHELSLEQNRRLMGDFVREEFSRHGYVAHFAIHAPDREGDQRNIHAHILVSMRKLGPDGFAKTKTEQQDNFRNRGEHVEKLREKWERLGNRHLERAGFEPTLDRRSLQDRGIDREPEQHKGPTVTGIERNGEVSHIAEEIRDRQALDAARRALAAEAQKIDAQIIDLQAARAAKEARQRQKAADRAETRGAAGRASHGPEIRRAAQEIAGPGAARFQQTMIDKQLARRDEATQGRVLASENSTAERDAGAADREARTAAASAERGVEQVFGAAEKAATAVFEAIAAPLEGIANFLGDMLSAPAAVTPDQAERAAAAAVERQAEAADRRAAGAKEKAQDDQIAEQNRTDAGINTETYNRYGVIRRSDQPRERGDDYERERER